MDAPTGLLAGGAAAALGAANALRPLAEEGPASFAAFAAGAVISEIPLVHAGTHTLLAAALVSRGGLSSRRGWVGLGLTGAAAAGAFRLSREGHHAGADLEQALVEALGAGYRDRILYPSPPADLSRTVSRTPGLLSALASRRRFLHEGNIAYGPFGRRNLLDVWRSPGLPPGTTAPVVVQVHGGAWAWGSKTGQAYPLLSHLVRQGWICVAVNYRLSPRSTWPDQLVDVKRAVTWVKENIAGYGGDPGFVAITGGSAGGHLSALVGLTAGDPAFQPGFEAADTSVAAAVAFYGVYDWTGTQGVRRDMVPFLERKVVKTSIRQHRQVFVQASPIERVHAGAPPFFVLHGDRDILAPVEQARRFADRLRATSMQTVAYAELRGAHHAFEVLSSVRTAQAVRAVDRFLGAAYGRHMATRQESSESPRTPSGLARRP